MKSSVILFQFLLVSLGSASERDFTRAEAQAIVEAEITAQTEHVSERRAQLLEVPALAEWTRQQGGQRVVFRHVATPVHPLESVLGETVAQAKVAGDDAAETDRKAMNLTLFITVYDDEMTEFQIGPKDDGLTVFSNVPFTYLPAIENVAKQDVDYTFFSFVGRINVDDEGGTSRPDSTLFSTNAPEYVVFADGGAEVSPDVLEGIDILHRHYLEHATKFQARVQRAEALHAARERYLEENPPASRETIINFFPIRTRLHSAENN